MKELTAPIANIQKFSVHDGPGIRTNVFFKGCPLRCRWCQNPEMFDVNQSLMFLQEKCIGCLACIAACPHQANHLTDKGIEVDRKKCKNCGLCVAACTSGARELIGGRKTVSEVETAVLSDLVFYQQSNGGVTLSGGEVLMHAAFAAELFDRLHGHGIHTAIETSGFGKTEDFLQLIKRTDLLLYDVKHTNDLLHRQYTGVGTEVIQKNLMLAGQERKNIIIRIPLVPGKNDSEENMETTAKIAKRVNAKEIHLLPFHQMGESKWRDAGVDYTMTGETPADKEIVNRCAMILKKSGIPVNVGGHGNYEFKK